MSSTSNSSLITLRDRPSIDALEFRRFRGPSDYPSMLAVTEASKHIDEDEWTNGLDDIARSYRHLKNCVPSEDMIFAEVTGSVVGYGRIWWEEERVGTRIHRLFVHLMPEWRGQGIRRAMLHFLEQRATTVAKKQPVHAGRYLQASAGKAESDWINLLTHEGYTAVRWEYEMVRRLDEPLPKCKIPEGFTVRRVREDDVPAIWAAASEAFADHWGETDWFTPKTLTEWQESPRYRPDLWQVAWHGDEVAGMVLNELNEKENEEYKRTRGYTETICVRRSWRGCGLAKALIARSLNMWKERGMSEAAHGVDADNQTGALQLYESLGYKEGRIFTTYRKVLVAD
ncbi:GNAT family N-acetyltransferase [Candidatus Bipolaricaulota bacterium]